MAKRKKVRKPDLRTSVRLADHSATSVQQIQTATDWSYGQTISFLVDAGIDSLYHQGKGGDTMRGLLAAAIDAYETQRHADSLVKVQREKLNAAKKAARLYASPPGEPRKLPTGPIIVSGTKKRGRPRKAHSPVPPGEGASSPGAERPDAPASL